MKKILIVEDERGMQDIYRDMFSDDDRDFSLEIVADGQEGLKALQKNAYDLVILDVIMEPVTGDSFFVHMRSDENIRTIPVLVVSVISPELLERMKRLNHVHFLQKPITKEGLFMTINRILG